MKVFKNVLSGFLMGIANVIPGLSGGTMLVLTNTFEPLTQSISSLFMKKNPNRWKDFLFILQIVLGLGVGILVLSSLVPIFNQYIFSQMMLFFIGVILVSSYLFYKNEIKEKKNFKILWFLVGFLLCAGMVIFITSDNSSFVVNENPSIILLISLFGLAILSGATMIIPGISGSLILYMFGMYYTMWGYVKETIFEILKLQWHWYMIVPLILIGLGVIIGILLGAWLSKTLLKKYRFPTLSLIFGLILGGTIKLIPYAKNIPNDVVVTWNVGTILTTILAFILGAGLVIFLQYLLVQKSKKKC